MQCAKVSFQSFLRISSDLKNEQQKANCSKVLEQQQQIIYPPNHYLPCSHSTKVWILILTHKKVYAVQGQQISKKSKLNAHSHLETCTQ